MRMLCYAAAFLILCVGLAHAHSWYDPACCSERDCEPYKGELKEMADGYHLEDGTVILYSDKRIRLSADNEYHICKYPSGQIICFYIPAGGV